VAIADVFDALSMVRPYKQAWPMDRILEFIQAGAGEHFDPELVVRFMNIMPRLLEIRKDWDQRTVIGQGR